MRILIKIFLVFCLGSCASLPREAPILSQELGVQIQELENSHLNLVHAFFENEREEVREFVYEEWLPVFAVNFFKQPEIRTVWEQVVQSGSEEDRLRFILETAPVLQQQINEKYQELSMPLDRLEQKLITALQNKYANAKSINNSLTSFLYSASEVGENRERYLEMLGITEENTGAVINRTAIITEQLLETAETIQELEGRIREYKEQLEELLATF